MEEEGGGRRRGRRKGEEGGGRRKGGGGGREEEEERGGRRREEERGGREEEEGGRGGVLKTLDKNNSTVSGFCACRLRPARQHLHFVCVRYDKMTNCSQKCWIDWNLACCVLNEYERLPDL